MEAVTLSAGFVVFADFALTGVSARHHEHNAKPAS